MPYSMKLTEQIPNEPPWMGAKSTTTSNHPSTPYFQVQQWLIKPTSPGTENQLRLTSPEGWGWKKSNSILFPVGSHKPPAPDSLLNLISCGCKAGCGKACSCWKTRIKCSVLCADCAGASCTNATEDEKVNIEHPLTTLSNELANNTFDRE